MPFSAQPRRIFLAGPTAVGKSSIAIAIAERIGGEIISVDSMQVYRGLDIGTAKATAGERRKIPHHLIDVAELNEPFDAAKFSELARKAEAEIVARGSVPIFCGGTGFYFKAFLEGFGEAPPSDPLLRLELGKIPLPELLAELATKDPVTFARIDQKNPRRVTRAIEVIRLTGKPFSEQRAAWTIPAENATTNIGSNTTIIGLQRAPSDLRRRIDLRVDAMFADGLIEETRRLLSCGLDRNVTAMQAIGYRQVVEHLRGERPLAATVELVKIRTRQFAKRQLTWFRRQLPMNWIALATDQEANEIAARIIDNDAP
jgi:tRNA dimethylallyltransferase